MDNFNLIKIFLIKEFFLIIYKEMFISVLCLFISLFSNNFKRFPVGHFSRLTKGPILETEVKYLAANKGPILALYWRQYWNIYRQYWSKICPIVNLCVWLKLFYFKFFSISCYLFLHLINYWKIERNYGKHEWWKCELRNYVKIFFKNS